MNADLEIPLDSLLAEESVSKSGASREDVVRALQRLPNVTVNLMANTINPRLQS